MARFAATMLGADAGSPAPAGVAGRIRILVEIDAAGESNHVGSRSRAGRCRAGKNLDAGYHDRALRREEDVVATARYVVMNPVRAGLVSRIGDYPHWNAIWV